MRSGNLIIKPLCAKITHDTELLSKMNPFVVVYLGDKHEQTTIAKKEHLAPEWENELVFRYNNETLLNVEVWNSEKLHHKDLIGTAIIPLAEWLTHKRTTFSKWVSLFYKEKEAGTLLIEFTFHPDYPSAWTEKSPTTDSDLLIVVEEEYIKEKPIIYEKETFILKNPILQPIVQEKGSNEGTFLPSNGQVIQ